MRLSNLIAGGIAMSLAVISVALADDYNPTLDDPWRVYVGVFNASVDSNEFEYFGPAIYIHATF
jgi:hypothetical protein